MEKKKERNSFDSSYVKFKFKRSSHQEYSFTCKEKFNYRDHRSFDVDPLITFFKVKIYVKKKKKKIECFFFSSPFNGSVSLIKRLLDNHDIKKKNQAVKFWFLFSPPVTRSNNHHNI